MWEIFRDANIAKEGGFTWRRHGDITCVKKKQENCEQPNDLWTNHVCIVPFNHSKTSITKPVARYAKPDGSLTMVIVLTGAHRRLHLSAACKRSCASSMTVLGGTGGWRATRRETKRQHFSSLMEMVILSLCLSPTIFVSLELS